MHGRRALGNAVLLRAYGDDLRMTEDGLLP
jgi:hypothetical protein